MSQKIKIAINGFGRIGRNLFRLLINHPSIEVVAINDIADNKTMSHLLKYDSIHGILSNDIQYNDEGILVDGKLVHFFHEKEIQKLNWKAQRTIKDAIQDAWNWELTINSSTKQKD